MISYSQNMPSNSLLKRYINSYTFSVGKISETSDKFITRAYPTYFTQFYFEFSGNISKISKNEESDIIKKGTFLNAGIGEWFDIFEVKNNSKNILVKNFKIDFYPNVIYELFNLSPAELLKDKVDIKDIWYKKQDYQDMLEQMEESNTIQEIINVFEKYFYKIKENYLLIVFLQIIV